MTDITERLRELSKARWDRDAWERETTVRIPAEPDRDIDLVLASAAEQIDRLRARVAELEAAKVEPVAWRGINDLGEVVTDWIDGPKPARLFDLCGNESGYASYQVAYTAPPAPRVDVDAISSDSADKIAERLG